jgi:hypothetical protein
MRPSENGRGRVPRRSARIVKRKPARHALIVLARWIGLNKAVLIDGRDGAIEYIGDAIGATTPVGAVRP